MTINKENNMKKIIGVALAALLSLGTVTACGPPNCPAGQVAESDDDGWECEPDEDGNGRDDEEDDEEERRNRRRRPG